MRFIVHSAHAPSPFRRDRPDRQAAQRRRSRRRCASCASSCASAAAKCRRPRQREATETADLAIVVGGDGTMLAAARDLVRHHVPLVGINQGRARLHDRHRPRRHAGRRSARSSTASYAIEERTLLDAEILRGGKSVLRTIALNEAVVGKGSQGAADRVRAVASTASTSTRCAPTASSSPRRPARPRTRCRRRARSCIPRCRRSRWCRSTRTRSRRGR